MHISRTIHHINTNNIYHIYHTYFIYT